MVSKPRNRPLSSPLSWHTENLRLSDCHPDPRNPRIIGPEQAKQLGESMTKFGYVEIIAVNLDRTILAGHQRHAVMMVQGRGDEMIDVRMPSRQLSPGEALEYNLRSNKNTGDWDWGKLGEIEPETLTMAGFSEEELKVGMEGLSIPSESGSCEKEIPQSFALKWQLLVEVDSEESQAKLLERLENEGYKCKPLIS
jgi:hypothetical protein